MAGIPFNGNASDQSGHGQDGIINGAALTIDRFGNTNSAFQFDGSSYITIPNNHAFTSTDFTISLWFKEDTLPDPSVPPQAAEFLISKGQNNFEIQTGSTSSSTGMKFLPRYAQDNAWDTPAGTYVTNRWQQVIAIYQPSANKVHVFVNGQEKVPSGPTTIPTGSDNQ